MINNRGLQYSINLSESHSFRFGFPQGRQQRRGCRESDRVTLLNDLSAKPNGQMRLSHSGMSEYQHVITISNEGAG